MASLPEAVVARLSDYRRHLHPCLAAGQERIFSHALAELVGVTAAQVRRDLMTVGFSGSPAKGYEIGALIEWIHSILGPTGGETMSLVGVGHLGRALLNHCIRRRPEVQVSSAFDVDPSIIGTTIGNCTVRHVDELESTLTESPALVGIVAVPRDSAQQVTDRLVASGVSGLINFAPVRVKVPEGLFVEHMDIATSAEKVLFFARQRAELKLTDTPLAHS
jgi:redox-sensing transcriptional repressor